MHGITEYVADERSRRGIRIAHQDTGSGRLSVVFLHGFLCAATMWAPVLSAMPTDLRLVAVDFPGHGLSDRPRESSLYTEDVFADVVRDLLDQLSVAEAVIVGFSMGGGVALNLAAKRAPGIVGLVLVDVGGGSSDKHEHGASMRALADLVNSEGMPGLAGYMLESTFFRHYAERGDAERREIEQMILCADAFSVEHTIRGVLAARQPVQDRPLGRIEVPTAVAVGEYDLACAEPSRVLCAKIRDAELTTIGGAGHMTPLETPEDIGAIITELIARVRRNSPAR